MRYFYMEDGILTEYLGFIKSDAEMAGYATYNGNKSVDWLKINDKGIIEELTQVEYDALHPFDPTKHIFSKYKVKMAMQSIQVEDGVNLWQSVKNTLTPDQYEDMMLAQDFSLSDSGFMRMYTQLTAFGVDIDAILKNCILDM